jgi:hypothetical protein
MNDVKDSVEYAHTEIKDLKTENEMRKVSTEETKQRIEKLEKENQMLINSVVDLKARSMCDKLLFFNIQGTEKENTTGIIHKLLEEKMEMEDAARKVKIDITSFRETTKRIRESATNSCKTQLSSG